MNPFGRGSRRLAATALVAVVTALVALVTALVGTGSAGAQEPTTTTSVPATTTTVAGGVGVFGRLVNPDDGGAPVAGVEIAIFDAGGAEVETVTTDDDGAFEVPLPGPGAYRVELDVDSLPDAVELRNAATASRTFNITPDQRMQLGFIFGTDTTAAVSRLDKVPATLLDGLRLGLIIAMTAIGLSLVYGTTQFTNFAHGEAVTLGALVTWSLNSDAGLALIPSALIGVVASGVAGYLVDAGLWTPLRRRKTGPFSLMIVSFGLSIALIAIYQFLYGTRYQPYTQYRIQDPLFTIGSQNVPPRVVVTMVIAVVVLGAVGLFLQRARFGKAVRAVADNAALASASGIDTTRVIRLVWVLGTALAGLGGILYSLDQDVHFQQGQSLLLLMFAGITLGGLGTSFGAAVGCVLLGVAIQFSTLWVAASLKNVGAMAVLIVILMVRPQGVFGRRERVG